MEASGSQTGQDFLSEYRTISGKLKKRFLRRPNVADASDQFAKLAKKLKSADEPQYEGLCHLAIGRCEQSVGNSPGETEALIAASRSFLKAEKAVIDVGGPSYEEHLAAAIHSYNHAVRLLDENGDTARASGLCLELGDFLYRLDKLGEAVTFYQRAARLRPSSSLEYMHAKQLVAKCYIASGDHHNALIVLTEVAALAEQVGGRPPMSVYLDILGRCEVLRVLLLLVIQPTPQNVSPNLTSVLEKYAWESCGLGPNCVVDPCDQSSQPDQDSGQIQPVQPSSLQASNQYLSEEVFLLLQSIVMAVQVRDGRALAELEDYLVPHVASEPQQRDLLRILVNSMQGKANDLN